jgi:hypothetical protein
MILQIRRKLLLYNVKVRRIARFVHVGRRSGIFQSQPFCRRLPAGMWSIADRLQAICPTLLAIAKDFDSGRRREMVSYACPKRGWILRRVVTEKTCATCDCQLDESAI